MRVITSCKNILRLGCVPAAGIATRAATTSAPAWRETSRLRIGAFTFSLSVGGSTARRGVFVELGMPQKAHCDPRRAEKKGLLIL